MFFYLIWIGTDTMPRTHMWYSFETKDGDTNEDAVYLKKGKTLGANF